MREKLIEIMINYYCNNYDGFEDAADLIESLYADRWVSVEERLPEIPPPFQDEDGANVTPMTVDVIMWDKDIDKEVQITVWDNNNHIEWYRRNGYTHWLIVTPPKK